MQIMHIVTSNVGNDTIVPERPQIDDRIDNTSPRGGKYNLRPNANSNYSEELRY